jgi:hypothetical protein
MIVLNPSETITINRLLKDHTDTATYYVQAKIYNADTQALITTLNLTDNGNRWFSKAYKTPYDNTYMIGKRIVIITSVFTDLGYTTKSDSYGEEMEEYLIEQRWNQATMASLGGGSSFDYKEIRKIIKEELEKLNENLEPLVFPKEVDEEGLKNDLESRISKKIDGIIIPIPEKVDLGDLIEKADEMLEKLDVSHGNLNKKLESSIKYIKDELSKENEMTRGNVHEKTSTMHSGLLNEIKKNQEALMEMFNNIMDKTEESRTVNLSMVSPMSEKQTQEREKKNYLNKLMSNYK